MKAKAVVGLTLVVAAAGLAGCATNPKDGAAETVYVPYSERPLSAGEYWFNRDQEDRRETARARQLGQD